MLSFALIVFREMLEISLIVGILLAATHGLEGRRRWLLIGGGTGIAGSLVVAYFANAIASSVEGFGQEVFNATVLFLAAALIASTVLWMKRHCQCMCAQMRQLGSEVVSGRQPTSILAVATMLTILRDGSEVALLTQGVLVSGQAVSSLLCGAAIGIVGGGVIGALVYFGIIRSATRHLFSATSVMLILLAAGMVSQGVGFLSAADIMPTLMYPVWDTTFILSESSYIGQTMHVLVGYTARPSAVQCIAFGGTLVVIFGLSRLVSGQGQRRATMRGAAAAAVVITLVVSANEAFAIDKIYSPIVHGNEVEIETRGTYDLDHRDDKDNAYKQKFSVGYGLTDRYSVEILGEIEHEPNEDTEFEAFELENRYQLFEQGEFWIDAGLYFAAEWKPEDNEYGVEARILLEKPTGKFIHTANILFEREVLEDSNDGNTPEESGISWVSRYKLQRELEPGIEVHFELEDLDNTRRINDEVLSIGPSLWGAITPRVKYEVAGLFGATEEAPDFVARFLLEYEFAA